MSTPSPWSRPADEGAQGNSAEERGEPVGFVDSSGNLPPVDPWTTPGWEQAPTAPAGPTGPNGYGPNPYGPNPYGPNPYGPNPYGPNPYGPKPYGQAPPGLAPFTPRHPQATTVLVLGIVGFVIFPLVAPVAWGLGQSARREVRQQPGRWSGDGEITTGWVLGIIATLGWVAYILLMVLVAVVALTTG